MTHKKDKLKFTSGKQPSKTSKPFDPDQVTGPIFLTISFKDWLESQDPTSPTAGPGSKVSYMYDPPKPYPPGMLQRDPDKPQDIRDAEMKKLTPREKIIYHKDKIDNLFGK